MRSETANWYTSDSNYDSVLACAFVFAAIILIASFGVRSPFGRFGANVPGFKLRPRLGWFLMELPSTLSFAYFYFRGPNATNIVPIFFLVVWLIHYGHRGFYFPLMMREPKNAVPSFHISVLGIGMLVTTTNGYLVGNFVSTLGEHLTAAWFADPRFIVGMLIYVVSLWFTIQSDRIQRDLRSPAEVADGQAPYRVPHGGMYRWVSCPSYLTEITGFFGLAVATWCLGMAFICTVTIANLVPRARTVHQWYRGRFSDYPSNRRALIPFVW